MSRAGFVRWATDAEVAESWWADRRLDGEERVAWCAKPEWTTDPAVVSQLHKCRHSTNPKCPNQPVAVLYRHGYGGASRWAYCAEHIFGNRIEDGRVLSLQLRTPEEVSQP